MADGRFRQLRPRTKGNDDTLHQPQGQPGREPPSSTAPVVTFETQLSSFPAEITVGASAQVNIPIPPRCAQVAFISVTPGTWASINGGGTRTIKDGFIYNGKILSLDIVTDGTGGCIVQLAAY